ncbi:MAG: molybdopterin molybdotransferase MoeA [Clostridia bacterium]|nr:molybdopterin molybdotransferase MoeA [Clostridia bacterium]
MLSVKSVTEVYEIIKENFSLYALDAERISIKDAVGRTLASDILADEDIPHFDRSSVDGYAVISKDTFGASDSIPAQLQIIGTVKMGEEPHFTLKKGQAAYVPTGGQLPKPADAVVMIEYTQDYNDGYIYIEKPQAPGSHVVYKGDDIKRNDVILKKGCKLRPQDIGVLAALGIGKVQVYSKLKVGIISTGDEIIDMLDTPTGAQVRDINTYTLFSGVLNEGCEPVLFGIIEDRFQSIRKAAQDALARCDIVLISGGSSVGNMDETHKVIDALGSPGVLVHGIAVKPGKPTILGKIENRAVLGLPGHPVSCYMIYRVFVGFLMDVMQGGSCKVLNIVKAKMVCKYPSNHGREEFLPVRLLKNQDEYHVQPVFGKSGLIKVLAEADGYVHIGRSLEGLDEGTEVDVVLF